MAYLTVFKKTRLDLGGDFTIVIYSAFGFAPLYDLVS